MNRLETFIIDKISWVGNELRVHMSNPVCQRMLGFNQLKQTDWVNHNLRVGDRVTHSENDKRLTVEGSFKV